MTRGDQTSWRRRVVGAAGGLTAALTAIAAAVAIGHGSPAAAHTAPPPSSLQSDRVQAQPVLAVYGDSYTTGSDEGGIGPDGWPVLVGDQLGARTGVAAAGGAGYVEISPFTGETFLDLVRRNPEPDADVVVILGSRNDAGSPPADIEAAASAVYAALRQIHPDAPLVVIGPPWVDADVPASVEETNEAVRRAAAAAGATFVDPLAEGWFFDAPELIGDDGIHPTDDGHAYLARVIAPHVQAAIDRVPARTPGG